MTHYIKYLGEIYMFDDRYDIYEKLDEHMSNKYPLIELPEYPIATLYYRGFPIYDKIVSCEVYAKHKTHYICKFNNSESESVRDTMGVMDIDFCNIVRVEECHLGDNIKFIDEL